MTARAAVKWAVVLLIGLGMSSPAFADSCAKSRDYILQGLAGDLTRPSATYRDLFKVGAAECKGRLYPEGRRDLH